MALCDQYLKLYLSVFYLALTSTSNPMLGIDVSISDPDAFADNQTGVMLGDSISLECSAKYSSGSSTPPAPQWLKNGVVVVEEISHISFSNNGNLLEIMNFAISDAGVYQCLFTDTDGDAEILTTVPFRIDTGKQLLTQLSTVTSIMVVIMYS